MCSGCCDRSSSPMRRTTVARTSRRSRSLPPKRCAWGVHALPARRGASCQWCRRGVECAGGVLSTTLRVCACDAPIFFQEVLFPPCSMLIVQRPPAGSHGSRGAPKRGGGADALPTAEAALAEAAAAARAAKAAASGVPTAEMALAESAAAAAAAGAASIHGGDDIDSSMHSSANASSMNASASASAAAAASGDSSLPSAFLLSMSESMAKQVQQEQAMPAPPVKKAGGGARLDSAEENRKKYALAEKTADGKSYVKLHVLPCFV